jgi:4-hydroxy-tetrahydrodipicolinate synthase
MQTPIQGSYVALPTPFHQGRLDLERLESMIERITELGADGLLVAGTTGEAPTLNDYEHRSLLHAAVEHNRGRLNLMAGIGTNCTRTSVELARFAATAGVDALMAVTPYYNRPGRRGLLLHYGQIADATDLPLVLYNVPKRTGVDLTLDVVADLAARHESIVAIKETTTSIQRVLELVESVDLAVLCGDDSKLFDYCAVGALGAVSVVANLTPRHVSAIIHSACGDDLSFARDLQLDLMPLIDALARETNPVPIKAALAELGLCEAEVRAPLVPADEITHRAIRTALATCPDLASLEVGPVKLD